MSVSFELLAGNISHGHTDGTGAVARFFGPCSVAVDGAGNVYVADTLNHTIRKVTPAGVVTTLAGTAGMSGSADGTGAAARFSSPKGVAVDTAGNVYVADTSNYTIRKVTAAGVVITLAGTAGMRGSADGAGAAASFDPPSGVAVDGAGNVYVADAFSSTIRKVTGAGVVTTLAGTAYMRGSADGTGAAASFWLEYSSACSGVAVDSTGNIYVGDTNNSTIRKVTAAGVVTTLAGTARMPDHVDGTGAAARFNEPSGVAVDGAGNIYVADTDDTIRKVTAAGVVTTLAGTAFRPGSTDGTGAAASFYGPSGVAVDSAGNFYIADATNDTIRKVTAAAVVTTLAGNASIGSADGTGAAARFYGASGMAVDSAGNIYVADTFNSTIRKITAAGVVTTLAGATGMFGSTDGTGAAARFDFPSDVAVDSAGNVYVADPDNCTIRKVSAAGVVTTLAGTAGMSGSADGTGAAARFGFRSPSGVAVDSAGNVYVADTSNNTIRKVSAAGVVTTLAGTAGMRGSADGTGAAARFSFDFPFSSAGGVAVDSAGNIYVADTSNNTIRKVTPAGVTTTLAGTAGMSGSADGTGAAARFGLPSDVAVDGAGNVYVTDMMYSTIRKITPAGVTTTVDAAQILPVSPGSLAIVGDSFAVNIGVAIGFLRHAAR